MGCCIEEEEDSDQFESGRDTEEQAPVPAIDVGELAQGNTDHPKGETRLLESDRRPVQRRLRIEANAEDEAANPAEHLRVAVSFHPCRRQAAHSMMRADRHQI